MSPPRLSSRDLSSDFAPALLTQFGDVTRKTDERSLNPMPVRVKSQDDSLIFVLGGFPTSGARRANMKGPDVIRAHKRCREQRRCHRCLSRSWWCAERVADQLLVWSGIISLLMKVKQVKSVW